MMKKREGKSNLRRRLLFTSVSLYARYFLYKILL